MKEIGGYFEIELRPGNEYHSDAIALNTGRNGLEYILRAKETRKLFLPSYTCDAVLDTIRRLSIDFEQYPINRQLDPIALPKIGEGDALLYTNYFGIKRATVEHLAVQVPNLIVDNAHAFFEHPLDEVDTFYSARKFFGVPDGAYVYTGSKYDISLEVDQSYSRILHLMKRPDTSGQAAYSEFRACEDMMSSLPVRRMSRLTRKMLASIDYEFVRMRRQENFKVLHKLIGERNELAIVLDEASVPMVYPFVCSSPGFREHLSENRIYVAQYWQNVLRDEYAGSNEKYLSKNLIPLPIDQRYCAEDMADLANIVNQRLN